MYLAPIYSIIPDGKPINILEIGFGIGYGLGLMYQMGFFHHINSKYVGCEPDKDSYDYTYKKYLEDRGFQPFENIKLRNCGFRDLETGYKKFDYSFCIEVIEHLSEEDLWFLCKILDESTKDTIFLSTPDPAKSKEGKWSMHHLENLFRDFFRGVSVVRAQWTNLWILNP
jgi:cyclopropane fatty-acyl-phospholipid synthase-like methyltransferase